MKIASTKNDSPSTANGRPRTSPKRPISPGHNRPISKLSTVPDTAPIANSTADTFDQRFARRSAVRSLRRIPRRCITKIIVGNATPKHARMMCQPSETAICSRAGKSSGGAPAAKLIADSRKTIQFAPVLGYRKRCYRLDRIRRSRGHRIPRPTPQCRQCCRPSTLPANSNVGVPASRNRHKGARLRVNAEMH